MTALWCITQLQQQKNSEQDSAHYFEFFSNDPILKAKDFPTIQPFKTIDGDDMQELMTEARMRRHKKSGINFEQAYECRAKTWESLERALKEGKAKMIGVSNYPANLLREMAGYARVMPAVN